MAKQTITELVDDIDGGPADETIKFGLEAAQYEVDLSKANAEKLRDLFAPYIAGARKIGRGGTPRGSVNRTTYNGGARARDRNNAIREWAATQGITVADRGRIKQEIIDQYDAAHA